MSNRGKHSDYTSPGQNNPYIPRKSSRINSNCTLPKRKGGSSILQTRERETMDRETYREIHRLGLTAKSMHQQRRLGPCQQICRSLGKCEPGREMEFYKNIIKQCRLFLQESLLMNDRKRITRIYLKALEKLFRLITSTDNSQPNLNMKLDFQPFIIKESPQKSADCRRIDPLSPRTMLDFQPSLNGSSEQIFDSRNETLRDFVDSSPKKYSSPLSLEEELRNESGLQLPSVMSEHDGTIPLPSKDQSSDLESLTMIPASCSTKSFKKMKLKEIKKEVTEIRHKINSLKQLLKDHQTSSSSINEHHLKQLNKSIPLSTERQNDIKSDITHLRKELRSLKIDYTMLSSRSSSSAKRRSRKSELSDVKDHSDSYSHDKDYCGENDCSNPSSTGQNFKSSIDKSKDNLDSFCLYENEKDLSLSNPSDIDQKVKLSTFKGGDSLQDEKYEEENLSLSELSSATSSTNSISQSLVASSLDRDLVRSINVLQSSASEIRSSNIPLNLLSSMKRDVLSSQSAVDPTFSKSCGTQANNAPLSPFKEQSTQSNSFPLNLSELEMNMFSTSCEHSLVDAMKRDLMRSNSVDSLCIDLVVSVMNNHYFV